MTQELIAILIIVAAAAYAIYAVIHRLNTPGDCGCGCGKNCPHKQKGNDICNKTHLN